MRTNATNEGSYLLIRKMPLSTSLYFYEMPLSIHLHLNSALGLMERILPSFFTLKHIFGSHRFRTCSGKTMLLIAIPDPPPGLDRRHRVVSAAVEESERSSECSKDISMPWWSSTISLEFHESSRGQNKQTSCSRVIGESRIGAMGARS
jgi:hypothetical protein